MAIEAVALAATQEVTAGAANVEATHLLAEKVAMQTTESITVSQNMTTIEQGSHTEQFQVGELSCREINAKDVLKQKETIAINELSDKLENNYTWNDKLVYSDANEKVYSVTAGEDAYILNGELPENATIKVDNPSANNTITVKTDDLGRHQTTEIDSIQRVDGVRDLYQQQRCRYLKDGLVSDDAGHLLAREFGGPGEQINYQPMDSYTNRMGDWRSMEKDWGKALDAGGEITDIRIESLYEGSGKRPVGFEISYKENGNMQYRYIDNTPRPVDLVKNNSGTVEYQWKQGVQS